MARAPKKCGNPTCQTRVTGRTYCPEHTPSWVNPSGRRQRLPSNWTELCQLTETRAAGKCQALTHHPQCTGLGSECDHITPGDNHHPSNLQWLSKACHRAKTARETAERNRAQAKARHH